jgi:hypothetical protein
MSRRKTFRVLVQEKRLYAIDVDAYDESGAKELASDIFQHRGFASGVMVELVGNASCQIVAADEKPKESADHATN